MDDLKKWCDSSLWDDEPTGGTYAYPLVVEAGLAAAEGLRLAVGVPEGEIYRRGPFVCAKSPESHIGPFKHAIDFLVPDGTPVYAARGGVVIEVQESFGEWGDGPEFRDKLNYMTIRHLNGECSQYCHLARGSVSEARIEVDVLLLVALFLLTSSCSEGRRTKAPSPSRAFSSSSSRTRRKRPQARWRIV